MNRTERSKVAAHVVAATQRQLPPEIRRLARDVPVHYERRPAADVIADGFPDDILGLFAGTEQGRELAETNPAPPQILLYLDNLWDFAEGDVEVYREETRLTYLHELGHYLGWDEDDVAAHGLE
jgi:predicted Zn-dependent protease with MMP-like domain